MRLITIAVLLLSISSVSNANEQPTPEDVLEFIVENELDSNLYNLLAATIPSTPGGQAIFLACGSIVTEDLFENGYAHVQKELGDMWREALADVYRAHLTIGDLERLRAIAGAARMNAIAETLTAPDIVEGLRANLSPLVQEATELQLNQMADEAEGLCKEAE